MFIDSSNKFDLSVENIENIRKSASELDEFSSVIFYRTYSRIKTDGSQENWVDAVVRVINGVMTIRKDYYTKHMLKWDDMKWQTYALNMGIYMSQFKWLPAGRGLYSCGTDHVYKYGSASLNNCGAVDTSDLLKAIYWGSMMSMLGVGIGFNTAFEGPILVPQAEYEPFVIPDSREGWADSITKCVHMYVPDKNGVIGKSYQFDYSLIRPKGAIIKSFGGNASGPEPLRQLHIQIHKLFQNYLLQPEIYTYSRIVVDLFNYVGIAICSGGTRRSAQIAVGSANDDIFIHLKDYERYPERMGFGWISNNSVVLEKIDDFKKIKEISEVIKIRGEPGILNMCNIHKYGRYGKEQEDKASLVNPCGEICLESYELCNLSEIIMPNCTNQDEFMKSLEYGTFYCSTLTLLPTFDFDTNQIIARNRRIGVCLDGIADILSVIGATYLTKWLKDGYKLVRKVNEDLAIEAGIPKSIKVTAIKPSGSLSSLVPGTISPGIHFPTFKHSIRRVRINDTHPINVILQKAGIPYEPDVVSKGTLVYEFPITSRCGRTIKDVTAWEQFSILAMMQREWADNMVSCTIYFDKSEYDQIEYMLAQFMPVLKSVSLLPHTEIGVYKQMPYECITYEEYLQRKTIIKKIDWTTFYDPNVEMPKYCTNETCTQTL